MPISENSGLNKKNSKDYYILEGKHIWLFLVWNKDVQTIIFMKTNKVESFVAAADSFWR